MCKSCLSLTYRESGKHDQHKEFSDSKHFSYIREYPTCRETHPSIRIKNQIAQNWKEFPMNKKGMLVRNFNGKVEHKVKDFE